MDTPDIPAFELVHWVAAPVGEVFRYFTEPARMLEWHGVEVRLDPKPGGEWWVRHANGAVLAGVFQEVEPPHLVAFTWGFEAGDGATPAGSSRVEVRLSAEGAGTRIALRHTGFAVGDPVGDGWHHFLPELVRAV